MVASADPPARTFWLSLDEIQPSQLFISSAKLSRVMTGLLRLEALDPVPVKPGNRPFFTDGHTRAFAAFLCGVSEIEVFWEDEDLDWEAYAICVQWCEQEGIHTIADLKDRVVSPKEYEVLWLKRCEEMQKDLEKKTRARAAPSDECV